VPEVLLCGLVDMLPLLLGLVLLGFVLLGFVLLGLL
jgi:hypothetical protein